MKIQSIAVSGVALLAGLPDAVSATWFYPLPSWRPISFTLPGSSFKKRAAAFDDQASNELVERGLRQPKSYKDVYSACSRKNMASKFNGFPINGFLNGGARIGVQARAASAPGDVFSTENIDAPSAYDCCVRAQQNSNSALFYFRSSAAPVDPDDFAPFPANCVIVSTSQCQSPNEVTIILGAAYNGTERRGTNYFNYLGNGRCGPGIRSAYDYNTNAACAAASAQSFGGTALAGASAGSCSSPPDNVEDQGGFNPAG